MLRVVASNWLGAAWASIEIAARSSEQAAANMAVNARVCERPWDIRRAGIKAAKNLPTDGRKRPPWFAFYPTIPLAGVPADFVRKRGRITWGLPISPAAQQHYGHYEEEGGSHGDTEHLRMFHWLILSARPRAVDVFDLLSIEPA